MIKKELSNRPKTFSPATDFGSLSLSATDLLTVLMEGCYKTPILDWSVKEMAKAIGRGETVTWEAKKELIDRGIIYCKHRNPGSNLYWLNPEFTNNAIWHNKLKDWFSVYPVFNSILTGISCLLIHFCPGGDNPFRYKEERKEYALSLRCNTLTQLCKVEKENPPNGETLPPGIEMEAKCSELVEKIIRSFAGRGATITVSEEKELLSFPHDALVSACNALKGAPDEKYPKALFWAELRRATCAVAGRKPDFALGEKRYEAKRAAHSAPVYGDLEEQELENDLPALRKLLERASARPTVGGYNEYDKQEAKEMKRREKQVAFTEYVGFKATDTPLSGDSNEK